MKTARTYISPTERIAAFDNDRTLEVEQAGARPDRSASGQAVEHVKAAPSLAQQVPWAVAAFLKCVSKAWEDTTPDEYEAEVLAFLAATKHQRFDRS